MTICPFAYENGYELQCLKEHCMAWEEEHHQDHPGYVRRNCKTLEMEPAIDIIPAHCKRIGIKICL